MKKRFAVSDDTNKAISAVMEMAEKSESKYHNTLIKISNIQQDPNNPRQHCITIDDLKTGIKQDDPLKAKKLIELESLTELSQSIAKDGLINPIVVVKDGAKYRLIAGERRLFASLLAKKTHIETRAFLEKPKHIDMALIQWSENESRKNLTLKSRLKNVSMIIELLGHKGEVLTSQSLADALKVSRALAGQFLGIIKNKALMDLIQEESITSIKKARDLISLNTKEQILTAIDQGELRQSKPIANSKNLPPKSTEKVKRTGRARQAVNLGKTKNPLVVKLLVDSVIAQNEVRLNIGHHDIDWDNLDDVTDAFTKLVKLLEKKL